jgi:hypothetical protein
VGITDVLLFGAGVALVLAWYADVRAPRETTQLPFAAEPAQ